MPTQTQETWIIQHDEYTCDDCGGELFVRTNNRYVHQTECDTCGLVTTTLREIRGA